MNEREMGEFFGTKQEKKMLRRRFHVFGVHWGREVGATPVGLGVVRADLRQAVFKILQCQM